MNHSEIKINEIIKNRRSPRAFSSESLSEEGIFKLFEAARWAPSSFNEQPWKFLYAMNGSDAFSKIADTLSENNKLWAPNAPVLIVALAEKFLSRNGSENKYALYDLGSAVAGLSFQASAMEIFVHPMGGFDQLKLRENLDISDDYLIGTIIAAGRIGDPSQLPEKLKEREFKPRIRKPLDEIVKRL